MADDMELRQELKKMREKLRKQARMHETLMVEYAKHDESAVEELQAVTLELEALVRLPDPAPTCYHIINAFEEAEDDGTYLKNIHQI